MNSLIEFKPTPIDQLNKFLDGILPEREIQYALTSHLIAKYPGSLKTEPTALRVNEKSSIAVSIEYLTKSSNSISGTLLHVSPSGIRIRSEKGTTPKYISYYTTGKPSIPVDLKTPSIPPVIGGNQHIIKVSIAAEVVYLEAIQEEAAVVKKTETNKKKKTKE